MAAFGGIVQILEPCLFGQETPFITRATLQQVPGKKPSDASLCIRHKCGLKNCVRPCHLHVSPFSVSFADASLCLMCMS